MGPSYDFVISPLNLAFSLSLPTLFFPLPMLSYPLPPAICYGSYVNSLGDDNRMWELMVEIVKGPEFEVERVRLQKGWDHEMVLLSHDTLWVKTVKYKLAGQKVVKWTTFDYVHFLLFFSHLKPHYLLSPGLVRGANRIAHSGALTFWWNKYLIWGTVQILFSCSISWYCELHQFT